MAPLSNLEITKKMGISGFYFISFGSIISNYFNAIKLSEEDKKLILKSIEEHRIKKNGPFFHLYGKYKGKNIIIVLLESFENFPVGRKIEGEEITPYLNSLMKESFYFPSVYSHIRWGSTTDAEFSINTGLYPLTQDAIYRSLYRKKWISLPSILKKNGYKTYAFHANESSFWNRENVYPFFGIEKFFSKNDYMIDEIVGMGLSDRSFFIQTAEKLNNLHQPFYALIISLTCHYPYTLPEHLLKLRLPSVKSEMLKRYLNCLHYVDESLNIFINELKNSGILNSSILVITGDHFASWKGDLNAREEINHLFSPAISVLSPFNVPLFIRLPDEMGKGIIKRVGGHKDVFPTLLFLTGFDEEKTVSIGNNLLSEEEGLVFLPFFGLEGSWVSDKFYFISYMPENCFSFDSLKYNNHPDCANYSIRASEEFKVSDLIVRSNFMNSLRIK